MMYVNRLQSYFETADLRCPMTGFHAAFENLVDANAEGFVESLETATSILSKYTEGAPAKAEPFLDMLLTPGFYSNRSSGVFFATEFQGDELQAHRVKCAAALLFMVGWKRLPDEARCWCRNLARCTIAKDATAGSMRSLIEAKAFVGSLFEELVSFEPATPDSTPRFPRTGWEPPIDPYIGL